MKTIKINGETLRQRSDGVLFRRVARCPDCDWSGDLAEVKQTGDSIMGGFATIISTCPECERGNVASRLEGI